MKKIIKLYKIKYSNSTKHLNKLFLLIPLFLLSFSLFITCIRLIQKETIVSSAFKSDAEKLQSKLANSVIRLHVIANSDSDDDQSLKYLVRNTIIEKLRSSLTDVKNMEDAENIIARQLAEIEQTALRTIGENGYCYSVNATICNRVFPIKTYGDLTFPAGEYRALCIEIGEAKGKNWWCVLFPSLCFIGDTTAVVTNEAKEHLRTEIGEKDYLELEEYSKAMKETSTNQADEEKSTLEVHSALYDWICSKFK